MKKNVLKTAVIGTNFVGKTSLCQALTNRTIDRDYTSTIGIDYLVTRKKGKIELALWDLAGSDKYNNIIFPYIRESPLLIFCYSAESYESYCKMLEKYDKWINSNLIQNKRIIIVATKIDSKQADRFYANWPIDLLTKTGYTFVKTSAFNGDGIQELFELCVENNNSDKQLSANSNDHFELETVQLNNNNNNKNNKNNKNKHRQNYCCFI